MRAALLLVLFLPLATAYADRIGVQYEGTVTEVGEGPVYGGGLTFDYAVGDRIAGLLFIDPSLATQRYPTSSGAYYRSNSQSFVSGIFRDFGPPQEELDPTSADEFGIGHNSIIEGIRGPVDDFYVQDGTVSGRNSEVDFWIGARSRGFLKDAGTHPSFELTPADVSEGGYLFGTIIDVNQGWNAIKFAVSHLAVKPGRCFAPS
jgi:hypothetical protein